jgi:EAL domain-containing protein (putative c-di-GMP-specific phosphodiesterase class I)
MATSPPQKPGPPPQKPEPTTDPRTIQPGGEGGQALYLRLLNEQLVGWDNPRAMLERALQQDDQFLLLGQKLLSLKPDAADPLLYEVLLRLKQEETNMLPPGGFFPIAEGLGMMPDIDRWVVRHVVAWGVAWTKKNPGKRLPLMCVNLSGETFEDKSFLPFLAEQLDQSGLPRRSLCFEVNETDIIEYRRRAQDFVAAVRPRCRVTLDSFGSVKVSFRHLAGLTVDFIKIDGVITQDIVRDPAALAKVRAINAASQKLGIRTIAEFVETEETLDKLREVGVDYVQGFGVARPEPISKIA